MFICVPKRASLCTRFDLSASSRWLVRTQEVLCFAVYACLVQWRIFAHKRYNARAPFSLCFLHHRQATPAQQVDAGVSAAGLAIDTTRTLFGGTRQQGLRAGTSRFLQQGWFLGWKVMMSIYCIVWAAWWDRGEDIDIRVYLATWTHLLATACECVCVFTSRVWGRLTAVGVFAYRFDMPRPAQLRHVLSFVVPPFPTCCVLTSNAPGSIVGTERWVAVLLCSSECSLR